MISMEIAARPSVLDTSGDLFRSAIDKEGSQVREIPTALLAQFLLHRVERHGFLPVDFATLFEPSIAGNPVRRPDGGDVASAMAFDEGLAERVRDHVGPDPQVTERKMFGGLCFMVGGNMSLA